MKKLLEGLQKVRPAAKALYRVAHEFEPAQPLMPYIDQYYSGSEVHAFVYSHMATPMMSPGRDGAGVHPGYEEKRRKKVLPLPKFMVDPARDVEDSKIVPEKPGMSKEEIAALYEKRQSSFEQWRDKSVEYASTYIEVKEWGIAPRAYPTGPRRAGALIPWTEADPLATTNPPTYTYSRCVQQTFNLRANIFLNGIAAVTGVRLMIPASWVEEPTGYDAPVLDHAVLAALLQMEHAAFFRYGRMLGETSLKVNGAQPKTFYAWLSGLGRDFRDVKPLVDHIGADDAQLGEAWRTKPLRDFISRGWDKQTADVNVVLARQIEHRVWEEVTPGGRRILYAFANVSNSAAQVRFLYGHGLEGTTNATPRRRKIFTIGGATSEGQAWLGLWEEHLHMAPRSFAAVVVE